MAEGTTAATRRFDWLSLPEGYYAVLDPDDPGQMTYWRRKERKGRRSGSGSSSFQPWPLRARYGPAWTPPADRRERKQALEQHWATRHDYLGRVVEAIQADPVAAGQRFARFASGCCCCGKALTDEFSKVVGIGPKCRKGFPAEQLALYMTPQVGRMHASLDE